MTPLEASSQYLQNEQWFEVSRFEEYILIINSYGRLRKLLTCGGYLDLHDGGPTPEPQDNKETE
jgi:hypothetical protein